MRRPRLLGQSGSTWAVIALGAFACAAIVVGALVRHPATAAAQESPPPLPPAATENPSEPPAAEAAEEPAAEAPAAAPTSDVPATNVTRTDEQVAARLLYQGDPFDIVRLRDTKHTELKVFPLPLADRRVPEKPDPKEKVPLRSLDQPDIEYEVTWDSIEAVRLFEQLMIDEVRAIVREGRFDDAFRYFEFLKRQYPAAPGLQQAIGEYLFEEAKAWHRKGDFEQAQALLLSLYEHDAKWPQLEAALDATTGRLVDRYVEAKSYGAARRLLDDLRGRFPSSRMATERTAQLTAMAARLVEQARSQLAAGRASEAHRSVRMAWDIWPTLEGLEPFLQELHTSFPRVAVGVTSLYATESAAGSATKSNLSTGDWPARRADRLLSRRLFEFAGYGAEGGSYTCSVGSYSLEELGRRIVIDVAPPAASTTSQAMTGYDVARLLAQTARDDDQIGAADELWGELLASVAVNDVYRIEADLTRAHVLPIALLDIPVADAAAPLPAHGEPGAASVESGNGAYQLSEVAPSRNVFVARAWAPSESGRSPAIIEEVLFANRRDAAEALARGDVSIVDRVHPAQVAELRQAQDIVVEPYAVPGVHCLVPNMTRPRMSNRTFRRALEYGIHRAWILERHILRGTTLAGCEVTSGPFAKGMSLDDAKGYAFDDQIRPRPYAPQLAMTLVEVARSEINGPPEPAPPAPTEPAAPTESKAEGAAEPAADAAPPAAAASESAKKPDEFFQLQLAYPPDDIAQAACEQIRRQWEAMGLSVTLRAASAGEALPGPDDDLAYVELVLAEPLTDSRKFLGPDGPAHAASAYMNLALQRVDDARGWAEARRALQEVHRVAHEEVSVIPLWQLTDHLAYRSSVHNIGTAPVSLYQHVREWDVEFAMPRREVAK